MRGVCWWCLLAAAAGAEPLWRVGLSDGLNAELALAPAGYRDFGDDALFVVGRSDPGVDWPYVQPGPADTWAGSRRHTFDLYFALDAVGDGPVRIAIDLLDTQAISPPRLAVELNGQQQEVDLPTGAGDASIYGNPAAGRRHQVALEFAPAALRVGLNRLSLTTLSGSWLLYDSLALEAAGARLGPPPAQVVGSAVTAPVLRRTADGPRQSVDLAVWHGGEPVEATIEAAGARQTVSLRPGRQTVSWLCEPVSEATELPVRLIVGGEALVEQRVTLEPVRRWEFYVLPHSHVDIGYTHLQADVEAAQIRYLKQAIEAARATESYPEGSRFRWNVEVLWAVDSYLRGATDAEQAEFIEAVRRGWIGLDALYGNELTALCRPEELVRLVRCATELGRRVGRPIETAMISDVPGYTWGLVPVLNAAGVHYFSVGPNGGARIGYTMEAWQDKPFWWVGPDGRSKVLLWIPHGGYWRAFGDRTDLYRHVARLEQAGYPYDVVQLRYCLGDNAGPAAELSDFVRDWNNKFESPRLHIATTAEMFAALVDRHGEQIPSWRGDFTPYWEDGAASSASETAANRAAAERLLQAETLFALRRPGGYPAERFERAWRNVILYDEHTWGAHNSIAQPDEPFVLGQWAVKQAFALDADANSRELLREALGDPAGELIEVLNTSSWPRDDLVLVPPDLSAAGDRVLDQAGVAVPSQRLSDGSLAFVARGVPGFGGRRYRIVAGEPAGGAAWATGTAMGNDHLAMRIDEATGTVVGLKPRGGAELVDAAGGGLNEYLYVPGSDPAGAIGAGPGLLTVIDPGPVVATVRVGSSAPGCRDLAREYRVVDGLPWLAVMNRVDKEPIRDKEGLHFRFAFDLPGAVPRIEVPFGVVRAEVDQIPGACRNWYTAQRFIDVGDELRGVTVATVDAPLVELGGITAETPWLRAIEPSPVICSYVMNNYWFTNNKADQEGPTTFRYRLTPRGAWDEAAAMRAGAEASQPLLVARAEGEAQPPMLIVAPAGVLVTALKPADDGGGWIVRLYGAAEQTQRARLTWRRPVTVYRTDIGEGRGERLSGAITVPAHGLVMLRAGIEGTE